MRQKLVFIVIMTFILAAFVQCSREHSESLSSEMARELALLPAPVAGLGYLNIKAVKESPFFSMVKENLEENPFYSDEYQEFIEATGLDIRRDIDELFICVHPEPEDDDHDLFVLVKGTYHSEKIMDYIMKKSADEGVKITSENIAQKTIYNLPGEDFSLCFADNNRLILGHKNKIKTWLDNFNKNVEPGGENALQNRVRAVRYKGEGWLSIDAQEMVSKMIREIDHPSREGRFEALESLQEMNASVKFEEKMKFYGTGQFSDPEKAQLFHDALKGLIATAKLSMSKDRKAVDVLNKIQTNSKGKEIVIEFEMSKEDIEKLKKEGKEVTII